MDFLNALAMSKILFMDLVAGCDRIAIAGDVRRREKRVKELELVVIPTVNRYDEVGLLGESRERRVDVLDCLLKAKLKDPDWGWVEDRAWWYPKHKRLRNEKLGMTCEISYAKIGSWGGAMAIHTGPPQFSYMLAMLVRERDLHMDDEYFLHRHPEPQGNCRAGRHCMTIVACPSEEVFFMQLGLPYVEPHERTEHRLKELIEKSKPYHGRDSFKSWSGTWL